MTNIQASEVLSEYIRTNKALANGLLLALEKAVTALEHAPDTLHNETPTQQQCNACGRVQAIDFHICACGSSDLRPIYQEVKP